MVLLFHFLDWSGKKEKGGKEKSRQIQPNSQKKKKKKKKKT